MSATILGLALAIGLLGLVLPPLVSTSLVGLGLAGVGAWLVVRARSRTYLPANLRRAGWLALAAGGVVLLDLVALQLTSNNEQHWFPNAGSRSTLGKPEASRPAVFGPVDGIDS